MSNIVMNSICLSLVASWIIQGCRIPSWLQNVFNTRLTIDKRVVGCRVIIGCRRRLKPNSSTADSLVISSGLNENHGLNPSQEIRKMWVHYWCPLTGCFFSPIRNQYFDWPTVSGIDNRHSQLNSTCTREALPSFLSCLLLYNRSNSPYVQQYWANYHSESPPPTECQITKEIN